MNRVPPPLLLPAEACSLAGVENLTLLNAATLSALERAFWGQVASLDQDACWPWRGPRVRRLGTPLFLGPEWGLPCAPADIVAWVLRRGELPPGRLLMRTCRVPACICPAHGRLTVDVPPATPAYVRHYRPSARVNDAVAREMRERFAVGDLSQEELSRRYGGVMSRQAVGSLLHGQSHTGAGGPILPPARPGRPKRRRD